MHKRFSQSFQGRHALLFARAHDAVDCNERTIQSLRKPGGAATVVVDTVRTGRRTFPRTTLGVER